MVDTWLVSCRVLGRGVEEVTLNLVTAAAQRLGARRLLGEHRPTAKNGIVREHYQKLGFAPLRHDDGGRPPRGPAAVTFGQLPATVRSMLQFVLT